jgi:hypothetical protein
MLLKGVFTLDNKIESRRVVRRRATKLEPILFVCRLSRCNTVRHKNHCSCTQTLKQVTKGPCHCPNGPAQNLRP